MKKIILYPILLPPNPPVPSLLFLYLHSKFSSMKKIYILFLITVSTVASGQNLEWARGMGGTSVDFGHAIAVDNAGNVYSTGLFANTADFDPGMGIFNLTSSGSWDIYIQKLDSSGIFQWAKRVGSSGDDRGLAIATDGAGIYLTGMFSLTVDFDPGAGTFNLASAGTVDVFVMKIDATGNFVWANRFGGSSDDHGNSIALDASSNVHVTGYFTGNASGIANLNSSGQTDIFILKLTSAGILAWAKKMGSIGLDEGNGITVSSAGNVYSTGTFQVTVDFNPGGGNFNLSALGGTHWDIYIQKLDAAGNFVWAKQIGASSVEDRGFAITTDAAENVYSTGYFANTADFDPGPGVYNVASNSGGKDVYIQKLDAAGNFVWATNAGGWLMDQGCAIDVDGTGNVYTAGFFQSTGDFDPGPGVYNLTATGGQDIFILKLSAAGNFMWALKFGANINDNGYASMTAISGSVYAAGFFGQTVDFDPGPGVVNLTSTGSTDVFIIKLNELQTPLPVEMISFTAAPVDNIKVKLNWITVTEINNDYFTVERSVDAHNWESVVQVDGNGNSNTTIEYKAWDYTPYSGISYYRLKQTDYNGQFYCADMVAVHIMADGEPILSPNPATDFIYLFSRDENSNHEADILNALGEVLIRIKNQNEIDISHLSNGIYFLRTKSGNSFDSQKFIKL